MLNVLTVMVTVSVVDDGVIMEINTVENERASIDQQWYEQLKQWCGQWIV